MRSVIISFVLLCAPISGASPAQDEVSDKPNVFKLPVDESSQQSWAEALKDHDESNFEDAFRFAELARTAISQGKDKLVEDLISKINKIAQHHDRFNDVLSASEAIASELNGKPIPSSTVGIVHLHLGNFYNKTNRNQQAATAYLESIAAFRKSVNPNMQALPLGNMAALYEEMGEYDTAISTTLQTFEFTEQLPPKKRNFVLVKDRIKLSRLYTKTDRDENAREQLDLAVRIAEQNSDLPLKTHAYSNLVRFLVKHNKINEAEKTIKEIESWIGHVNGIVAKEEFKIEKIRFLLATKKIDAALAHLEEIDFISYACSGAEEFYQVAEKVFIANEDFERAYYVQQKILDRSKSQLEFADQRQRDDANAMFQFQVQQKADQIRAENASRMAESERTIRNLMIALTTLACSMGLIFYRNHSKRKIEKLTLEKQKEINQDLSRAVDEKTAALFAEVTERAELQNALETKRRNEAIGQLTGGVAHDFNNLLQVILTVNELLDSSLGDHLGESDRKLLESSSHSAYTGAQIVQQLLAFARKQVLQPTAFVAGEFVQSQMSLLKTAAGEHINLQLHNDFPSAIIRVDSAQLTTSLINLISNAADAVNDQGQTIIVSVREQTEEDAEQFPELPTANFVIIEVKDNGCGMSDDEVSRACDPFFTTKKQATGTGLGLSSVLGFVKQSHGDLLIKSQPGRGTTIILAFPIADKADALDPKSTLPSDCFSSIRMLLVEDHPQVRMAIQLKLANLNISADCCESADKAIEILSDKNYDCVLTDIRMPGKIDGIGLHDWLKQNRPETHIILMTGFDHRDKLSSSMAVLAKPFTQQQLTEKLRFISSLSESLQVKV